MSKPITVPGGTILRVGRGKWLSQRWGSAAEASHKTREQAVAHLATSTSNRETTMKVKTAVKKSKPATKAKVTKAAKPAQKREAQRADTTKQQAEVAKLLAKGQSLGDIAEALSITAGKAAFLNMLNVVEETPRLQIKGRTDEEKIPKVIAARDKQDEHSSWGWLSARSGISEARLKALVEEAGGKVKGTHIAKERAGTATKAKPKAKTAKKGSKANPSK